MSATAEQGPSGLKPAGLVQRTATAAIYAIVVLGALWWGVVPTGVAFGVMGALAAIELYAMTRKESVAATWTLGLLAAAAMPIVAAVWGQRGLFAAVSALLVAALLRHTALTQTRVADTALMVFGALYTGFMLSYLSLLRAFEAGLILSLAVVVSVWANDVGAYLAGSMFGRHKMSPRISPKKSWEGFLAGTAACVAVWAVVPLLPGTEVEWPLAVTTGVAIALAAVIGDLAESRIKREVGVKDSGASLPGHGGFLDRLDSLILVGVVAYWVLWWGGAR